MNCKIPFFSGLALLKSSLTFFVAQYLKFSRPLQTRRSRLCVPGDKFGDIAWPGNGVHSWRLDWGKGFQIQTPSVHLRSEADHLLDIGLPLGLRRLLSHHSNTRRHASPHARRIFHQVLMTEIADLQMNKNYQYHKPLTAIPALHFCRSF